MSALHTDRARLAPFAPEDTDELLALFRDPDVRRYLLDDQLVPRAWVEQEIAASAERFASGVAAGLWAVRTPDEPRIVGFVGYREFFDPPQLQLLYGLHPDCWGRGLATEVAALARVGRDQLQVRRRGRGPVASGGRL